MEKRKEFNMTEDTATILRVFSELANEILCGGAYKVTKFVSPKLTIKATRKRYGKKVWHDEKQTQIMFTIGPPNYEEREMLKRAKKVSSASVDLVIKHEKK
jgi:hypothetical protein